MSEFKEGIRVEIAECYLTDECTENTETTPTAMILSEPTDLEELVLIEYENGLLDYVPQDILTII
jgi:hypothetical protein